MINIAILFVLGSFGIVKNQILSTFLIQIVVMLAIPLLLYSLFVNKKFKNSFKDFGFKKLSGKLILISIGLGFVLYFINTFIATTFSSIISLFGFENLSNSETITLNYQFLFKDFVLTAILPGICEEFLHRGILLHAGKKHTNNPRFCLIVSSLLFGLIHLNIKQFFYATILGFLMGIVAIASDSIYPCIIIHFMNNFLSSYFYYGTKLNWPLANIVSSIETVLMSNIFLFIISSLTFTAILIYFYTYLVKRLIFERTRMEMTQVLDDLNVLDVPVEQAQDRLNQINTVLSSSKSVKGIVGNNETKLCFRDKIFIISSIVLGSLVTIFSFIWGVLW